MIHFEIIYDLNKTFDSKYALYKDKYVNTEYDNCGLILESLILSAMSDSDIGKDKVEIDLNYVASNYVSILYQYKQNFSDFEKTKKQRAKEENLTCFDMLKGIPKRKQGRPSLKLDEKDQQKIWFGKHYIEQWIQGMDIKILEKNDEQKHYRINSIFSYTPKLEDDKLYLIKST